MKRSTFSVGFFLKKRKTNSNGRTPIYLRVTVNGERCEISVKRCIYHLDWDQKQQVSKKRYSEAIELNSYLKQCQLKAYECHKQLEYEEKDLCADLLKRRYTGQDEKDKKTLAVFDVFLEKCEQRVGKDMAEGTLEKYQLCRKQLQEYIKMKMRKQDLFLNQITYSFLLEWEHYMKTKKDLSHNTSTKRLKMFRTVIKYAINNGWLRNDPYLQFPLKVV